MQVLHTHIAQEQEKAIIGQNLALQIQKAGVRKSVTAKLVTKKNKVIYAEI
jgi:hypothetical protein